MRLVLRLISLFFLTWFAFMFAMLIRANQRKRTLPPPPDPAADTVELVAALGPLDFRSTATAFRGGRLECQFGGGTVDLRGATLHPDGADLRVELVFGGASLLVPNEWHVINEAKGIGGVGDARTTTASEDGPTLRISGVVLFGGLGVMSRDPQVDEAPATA
jgi:hypothetical protein